MNARHILSVLLTLALGLVVLVPGVVAQSTEYRPVEDPLYGISTVVPADWQDMGGGIHTRGTPPADRALLLVQSAPAAIDQLWPRLLPQFALDEVPDVTSTYSAGGFDWSLYRFDVALGPTTIAIELAMSEKDGLTYLLILQADAEEFEVLREQAFVPAIDAFAPLEPEPTPDPSTFDYSIEEVTFPGGADDVTLAGTLTLPDGPGPHPVIVTMTGSGPQDRDESLRPTTTLKPFAILADAITDAGIGVLRYDDRGVGGSTGDYNAATMQELAQDAAAAIDYLETRDDVDPGRIGLLGHSEGGLYAAMLGATDDRVAFIVMMAPAILDGVTLLVEQNEALARSQGYSAEEVEAFRAFAAESLPLAEAGDLDALETVVREFYGGLWDELSDEDRVVAGDREGFIGRQLDSMLPTYQSDWFRSLLAYDPADDWRAVDVPVLALFGGKDVQVIAESNEAALRELLAEAGNDDAETLVIPDANHLFQDADTGAVGEYPELEPSFIDGFVDAIVDWLVTRAGVDA